MTMKHLKFYLTALVGRFGFPANVAGAGYGAMAKFKPLSLSVMFS